MEPMPREIRTGRLRHRPWRLTDAPADAEKIGRCRVTPSYARVGAVWRQVFGMLEKGRSVVIIQPIVEGFARIRKRR